MAQFQKGYSGTGTWDDKTVSLTLKVAEEGEISIWGGGPNGSALDITAEPRTPLEYIREVHSTKPDERLFRFKGKAPGAVEMAAKVHGTGADYASRAHIVILPAKASSMAADHLVFFAGKGSDDESVAIEGYKKAEHVGGVAYHLSSQAYFESVLSKYRDQGRKIDKMEFNTHGAPGLIAPREGKRITKETIQDLKGKGLHRELASNAKIFFHGCNVAEGDKGEAFLREFGSILLVGGGGSVGASTSVGFSLGWIGPGKVYHVWGDTVVVFFDTTGRVTEVYRD